LKLKTRTKILKSNSCLSPQLLKPTIIEN